MDTRDRMIHYLSDANAAEVGILEVLEDAIELCDEPAKSAIREHFELTKSQAQRLERRLEQLGGDRSGTKGFMNTLMAKFGSTMDIGHDEPDRQTMCLMKLYATEHLECAMYESMAAYADAIGDTETSMLAREIQREEEMAARTIWPMIRQYATMPALDVDDRGTRESYPYTGP